MVSRAEMGFVLSHNFEVRTQECLKASLEWLEV